MDGLLFYWLAWMAWVVVVFFIPKQTVWRGRFLFALLTMIALSGVNAEIRGMKLNLGGLWGVSVLLYTGAKGPLSKSAWFIFKVFTIGIGYAGLSLFIFLDPIIAIIDQSWMQAALVNYTSLLLFKDWRQRLYAIGAGMGTGHLLISGVWQRYSFPVEALTLSWLDQAVLAAAAGLVWAAAETAGRMLYRQTAAKQIPKQ